jgi:hypothetical protein
MDIASLLFPQAPSYATGLLGEEEAKRLQGQARQAGLLNLGLGLLAAGGPAAVRPGLGQGLIQGLSAGQQAYQNVYSQRLQEMELARKIAEQRQLEQEQLAARQLMPKILTQGQQTPTFYGQPTQAPLRDDEGNLMPGAGMRVGQPQIDMNTLQALLTQAPSVAAKVLPTVEAFRKMTAPERMTLKEGEQVYEMTPEGARVIAGAPKVEKPIGLSGEFANLAIANFGTADITKLTPDQLKQLAPLVQQQKVALAEAGRPGVNVQVGETAGKELIKSQIARVDASQAAADTAAETLRISSSVKPLIDAGVFSGPLSKQTQYVARLASSLGVTGENAQQTLNRTSQVMQGLASLELEAAKGMRGQGAITESEREILRRASAGELSTFTAGEVKALLNAMEKNARFRLSSHTRQVEALRKILPEESKSFADVYNTEYEIPKPVAAQPGRSKW